MIWRFIAIGQFGLVEFSAMRWKLVGPVFLVSFLVGMWILKLNSDEEEKLTSVAQFAYAFWDDNGRWPNHVSELDLRRWQSRTVSYSNVVLAHPRHLSRNRAANRGMIVVYQYTGKRLWPYRWVCWGDLRTEYISNSRFERTMASQ